MRFSFGLPARFVLATLALAATASAGAEARQRRVYVEDEPPAAYSTRAPIYCQKLCSADTSPCDPPYFKHADGRCNGSFFWR